jgi:hypothetical protein
MAAGNLEIVIELLKAISEGKSGEELGRFYDEKAVQTEYPNLLSQKIVERSLPDILEASIRGKKAVSRQKYEIVKSYSMGDTVIVEAVWTGKLAVPIGKLAAGEEIKAYFAQFLQFKNSRIIKHRTYDCFENFL